MADNDNKIFWRKILDKQSEQIETLKDGYENFIKQNVDATAKERIDFLKEQSKMIESKKVSSDITKRINALEKIQNKELTSDDMNKMLDDLENKWKDSIGHLDATVAHGNTLMRSGFDKFKGVFQDSFGPVFDLWNTGLGIFGSIKDGLFGTLSFLKGFPMFFKSFFGGLFGDKNKTKQLDEAKEQTSLLQSMVNYFDRMEKRYLTQPNDKKTQNKFLKILGTIFGAAVFGISTVIGAFVGSVAIQFDVFYKVFVKPILWITNKLKDVKFFKKIKTFFSRFKIFGKMFDKISDWFKPVKKAINKSKSFLKGFGKIGEFLKGGSKLAKTFGVFGKFLKPLVSGLKFGMKVFGWPLTILLGLIDFFKAFSKTKGSMVDKIKAGLQSAIGGLVELPIKLLGWISDWVLGLFGTKVEGGTGAAMMDGIKALVGGVVDLILNPFKTMKRWLQVAWDFFSKNDQGESNFLGDFVGWLKDVVWPFMKESWVYVTPIGWAYLGIKKLYNFLTSTEEGEPSILENMINLIKDISSNLWSYLKENTPIGNFINGISWLYDYLTTNEEGEQNFFGKLMNKLFEIPSIIKDWILGLVPSVDDIKNSFSKGWKGFKDFIVGNSNEPEEKQMEVEKVSSHRVGGIVKKGGLVNVHPAEVIVPQDLSEKLIKQMKINDVGTIGNVDNKKTNKYDESEQLKKLFLELKKMQDKQINSIVESLKGLENMKLDPVVNNLRTEEPPDEIENLSLLVFNKSWGLG